MSSIITAKNSFNSGDAITMLAGLNHLYQTKGIKTIFYQRLGLPAFYYDGAQHPIKNDDGQHVCMNKATFALLKPLLESQPYIESAEVYKGENVDYDFDQTRDRKAVPMPYGNIHNWVFFVCPELSCDLSKPWIFRPKSQFEDANEYDDLKDVVILNRTSRYQNPYIHYYFLKPHQDKIRFIGLAEEHSEFCNKWGLDIKRIWVNDFSEIAKIFASCKGFIGNQSFCWQIAEAMKIPRILEYCQFFPNCHPIGQNGHAFLYQEAAELYFNNLLNS